MFFVLISAGIYVIIYTDKEKKAMPMSDWIIPRKELLEKIREFTLMDDTYMTAFFDGQPELIQLVLHIILDRDDLTVTESRTQYKLQRLQGHSAVLDVFAVDSRGTKYEIEIQSRSDGAKPKRARYYSSILDSNFLLPDDDYDELSETYVIFFTANDYFKKDLPLYTVNRHIEELGNAPFNDYEHILYINGANRSDTPLGKLTHDFKCKKPGEMFYSPLAERAQNLKETSGGNEDMCQIMEELNRKASKIAAKRTSLQIAASMLNNGKLSFEEIAQCCNISVDEVKMLAEESKKQTS